MRLSTLIGGWMAACLLVPAAPAWANEGAGDADYDSEQTAEHGKNPDATEPMGEEDRDRSSTMTDPSTAPGGEEYVVKEGDTLGKIAEKKLGSADAWRRIARANDLEDPDSLTVGKRLTIPGDEQIDGDTEAQPKTMRRDGQSPPSPVPGAD